MRLSSLAITLAATLTLCVTPLAGCSHGTQGQAAKSPAPEPWTGLTADVRAVWSAEPGIDLTVGPAVVVRAYIESYFQTKDLGNIEVAYPGFTEAVDPNPPQVDPPTGHPWPDTSYPAPYPIQGTDKYRILRIDTDNQRVSAVVCDYSTYTSGFNHGGDKFGYEQGAADDGVLAHLVSMTAPGGAAKPIPPQRGPAPSPTTDVFGGWRITGLLTDIQGDQPQWPTRVADVETCRDRAPDPIDRRNFLRQGNHPRSDYPTLPAYPGWPEAGPS